MLPIIGSNKKQREIQFPRCISVILLFLSTEAFMSQPSPLVAAECLGVILVMGQVSEQRTEMCVSRANSCSSNEKVE